MIENTYVEIGTGIGLIIAAIGGTLKFSNGGGKKKTAEVDTSNLVDREDCKAEHKEVKEALKTNTFEHTKIFDKCEVIGNNVATLLERTKK